MQSRKKLRQWLPGKHKKGFTLIEALLALVVTGLVLLSIQLILPSLKDGAKLRTQVTFQTALNQLLLQGYNNPVLKGDFVTMLNQDQVPAQLVLKKDRLVLAGEGAGQVILLSKIKKLSFQQEKGYIAVSAESNSGEGLSGELFLPRRENSDAIKK